MVGTCREAVAKSNFQTSIIAFFVFAAYFATKDNETSRLFLGFYVFVCWPILTLSNIALPGSLSDHWISWSNPLRVIIGDIDSIHELSDWIEDQKELVLT